MRIAVLLAVLVLGVTHAAPVAAFNPCNPEVQTCTLIFTDGHGGRGTLAGRPAPPPSAKGLVRWRIL